MNTFTNDLIGDGWIVALHNVAVSEPTNLVFEMPVDRIDFDNLPAFTTAPSPATNDVHLTELALLKRYLAKDHAYRRGDYAFDPSLRVFIDEKDA